MKNSNVIQSAVVNQTTDLLSWSEAFEVGDSQVGGKAWNISRLARYGFNVPLGFVIPIHVYQLFLQQNQLEEELAKITQTITLEHIADRHLTEPLEKLQNRIIHGQFSESFIEVLMEKLKATRLINQALAIRSSATAEDSDDTSFAGIHQSFLNVQGIDPVLHAIKCCFASLWSLQAIAYRRKMKIDDHQVLAAVVIMAMIDAEVAGVVFTCDPASGRDDRCLISANFGLGESVVNGEVEADNYYVDRHYFQDVARQLGKKQHITICAEHGGTQTIAQENNSQPTLNDEQLQDLALLVSRIFFSLGDAEKHQDIEWAIKDNIIYVLQARPVTVVPRYTVDALQDQADVWSNANFRDAVPMVISVLQRESMVHTINQIILNNFNDVGYKLKPGLTVVKLFQGRMYFNVALYQWLLYDALGMKPEDINLLMGGHQPDIRIPTGSPYFCKAGWRRAKVIMKSMRLIGLYRKKQQQFYAEVDRLIERFNTENLPKLSDIEFLDLMDSYDKPITEYFDKYMSLCGGIGTFTMAIKQLQPYFGDEAIGIVNALVAGQGDLPSANQGYELLELAEIARDDQAARVFLEKNNLLGQAWRQLPDDSIFKQAFAKYLDKYGFRSTYEMDISLPRWSEDPNYLLRNIAKTIATADLKTYKKRQRNLFEDAEKNLKKKVGFLKRRWVMKLINDAVKGTETRENAKAYTVRLSALNRKFFLEAGRRLFSKGLIANINDVFFCSSADVVSLLNSAWDGHGLESLIKDNKQKIQQLKQHVAPDVIINNELVFKQAIPIGQGQGYRGIAVSAGQIKGTAKIIKTPDEGGNLQPGDIMVAPSTDPSWTPLFIHAGGIVLETGGYTSHGSIVAREYGIPAVVNVAGVMSLIKENQTINVNGNNGTVMLD